jgi:hypothetical protein
LLRAPTSSFSPLKRASIPGVRGTDTHEGAFFLSMLPSGLRNFGLEITRLRIGYVRRLSGPWRFSATWALIDPSGNCLRASADLVSARNFYSAGNPLASQDSLDGVPHSSRAFCGKGGQTSPDEIALKPPGRSSAGGRPASRPHPSEDSCHFPNRTFEQTACLILAFRSSVPSELCRSNRRTLQNPIMPTKLHGKMPIA